MVRPNWTQYISRALAGSRRDEGEREDTQYAIAFYAIDCMPQFLLVEKLHWMYCSKVCARLGVLSFFFIRNFRNFATLPISEPCLANAVKVSVIQYSCVPVYFL